MDKCTSRFIELGMLLWIFFIFFVMLLYPSDMALAIEISATLVNLIVITFVLAVFRRVIAKEYLLLYSLVPSFGIYLAVITTGTTLGKTLYVAVYLLYYLIGAGILLSFGKDREYQRAVLYFISILVMAALTGGKELLLLAFLGLPLMVLLTKKTLVHEVIGFNIFSMVVGVISILKLHVLPASNFPLSPPNPLIAVLSLLFQQGIYSTSGFLIWNYFLVKVGNRLDYKNGSSQRRAQKSNN